MPTRKKTTKRKTPVKRKTAKKKAPVKRKPAKRKTAVKRLSLKSIRKSPWLEHVDETIAKFPQVGSYKQILKLASRSYEKKQVVPKKKRLTRTRTRPIPAPVFRNTTPRLNPVRVPPPLSFMQQIPRAPLFTIPPPPPPRKKPKKRLLKKEVMSAVLRDAGVKDKKVLNLISELMKRA